MSTVSPGSPKSLQYNLSAIPRTPLALAGMALALGLAVEILLSRSSHWSLLPNLGRAWDRDHPGSGQS